jgi:hypothetical protein
MNRHVAAFIGSCVLRYHGTHTLIFSRDKFVRLGKTKCSGWCDDKHLKVATGAAFEHWLGVLVHETCHIDQVRADKKWFARCEEGLTRLDAWLEGNRPVRVRKATLESIKLEHDCESRAIAKIRRHRLPIDVAVYTQKANAYLIGYHVTLRERKWCFRAYRDKNVYGRMPTRLLPLDAVLKPSAELLALFK